MENPLSSKILIVEDDEELRQMLRSRLEYEGFRVALAVDGEEALRVIPEEEPDLVILDLKLPGVDGLTVCRWIRKNPETGRIPILMLSGRAEEVDRILGLDMGADDFVTKPCNPPELIARVRALLRRAAVAPPARVLKAGHLEVDLDRYTVTMQGRLISLTSKEFDLLKVLMEAKGKVLRRDVLLSRVWGYERGDEMVSRTVDVHIRHLREKLGDEGRRIVTVRNVGYRFDVTTGWAEETAAEPSPGAAGQGTASSGGS